MSISSTTGFTPLTPLTNSGPPAATSSRQTQQTGQLKGAGVVVGTTRNKSDLTPQVHRMLQPRLAPSTAAEIKELFNGAKPKVSQNLPGKFYKTLSAAVTPTKV